jgi:ubiquinone/menaquinone biosynthesis C-methylase UbiE
MTLALARLGCTAVGLDASEEQLDVARRRRSDASVTYEPGDAGNLAYASASFDACVSTLAIDVFPEPEKAVAEMRRVTRAGGIVACGTFDFWGGFFASSLILDTVATIDESFEAARKYFRSRPLFWPNGQAELWRRIGFTDVTKCHSSLTSITRPSAIIELPSAWGPTAAGG